MSGKGKSRWADSEEDAAREAKARKEKEEKKRLKREKVEAARKAEEENKRQAAAATARGDGGNQDGRPAKRRRLTPERPLDQQAKGEGSSGSAAPRLLRFQAGGGFGRSNSVEKYDKLNDIEEGAYGWVARAKEIATGEVVALKRLKIDPNDRNGLPVTGLREIQILKDCEHRNIVKLREVVVGEDTAKIEKCVIHGILLLPSLLGKPPC